MVGNFPAEKVGRQHIAGNSWTWRKVYLLGNEDYYDALYKDHTFAQSHNVSVSGSNGKSVTTLPPVCTITMVCSIITRTPTVQWICAPKISAQVFDWLKISNNIDYTHDKIYATMGYVEQNEGLVWKAINMEGHPSELSSIRTEHWRTPEHVLSAGWWQGITG